VINMSDIEGIEGKQSWGFKYWFQADFNPTASG
jgi:hypothetical protein